jgi:hypothetical protein
MDGGNVAVFRTADDRVFALAIAAAQGGPLLRKVFIHGNRVALSACTTGISSSKQALASNLTKACTARYSRARCGRVGARRTRDRSRHSARGRDPLDLLLLWRWLRCGDRARWRAHQLRPRRSRPSRKLRQALQQGQHACISPRSPAAQRFRATKPLVRASRGLPLRPARWG